MVKMKLKGKNVKRIPKKKQEKMEKTLKRMEKARQIDSDRLRDIITGKLTWVKAEINKGRKQIENIRTQVIRLEGIKLFIEDLLLPPEAENKEKEVKN